MTVDYTMVRAPSSSHLHIETLLSGGWGGVGSMMVSVYRIWESSEF